MLDFRGHPLESRFPIGSHVLVTVSPEVLTAQLQRDWDMNRAESIGAAKILTEEPSEVVGINDLSDDRDGYKRKPYVTIINHDGMVFLFEPHELTPA